MVITYHDRDSAGRGMMIQQSPTEFLAVGVGFALSFHRPEPDGSEIKGIHIEKGRYAGERWMSLHPVPGTRAHLLEPGVLRISIDQ